MTNKRIVNVRVTCVAFIGLMLGILFAYNWVLSRLKTWHIVVIILFVLAFCIAVFVYASLTKQYNSKHEYRKNVSSVLKISSICFLFAFIFGSVLILRPVYDALKLKDFDDKVTVSGVVCDYVHEDKTYKKFIITNCSVIEDEKLNKLDCKIVIFTSKATSVKLGDKVIFDGTLNRYGFANFGATKLYQNIGYQCFVNVDSLEMINGKQSLKDQIKNATYQRLIENMNYDNATISYAVLFGEKQGLDQEISDMFNSAGISHILAVSGLHIGVLVATLYFIFKKLKLNKYLRVILLSLILLFYCYLCSFTPSVCRASIMAVILALCDIYKIEYDSLSSLSIAGVIILLISPLSLFTISFQLSFLCIFAIISLDPSITRLLQKIKTPKILASSLAISISTSLAIIPVLCNSFCKVGLLGVIANVFVLPLFSVTYVLTFALIVLSLILPFMGFLLCIPELFLHLIKVVADYCSQLDFAMFKVFSVSYWILGLIILFAIVLHFFMIKKYFKFAILAIVIVSVVSLFANCLIENKYSGENLIFCQNYKTNTFYYVKDNKVTMIGSDLDIDYLYSQLKTLKLKTIDNIIAYDLQLNDLSNLTEICSEFEVKKIYLPKRFEYDSIVNRFDNVEIYNEEITVGDVTYKEIIYNDAVIAVYVKTLDLGNLLVPELSPTKNESKYLIDNFGALDIIYLNKTGLNVDKQDIESKLYIYNDAGKDTGGIGLKDIKYLVINEMTKGEFGL